MPALWALAASDWIFAVGGLVFCLLAPLLIRALPQPRSGFVGVLLSPLNLLTSTGIKAVQKIVATFAPATFKPQQAVGAGLHDAARLVDDTAAALVTESAVTAMVAQALAGTATGADLAKTAAGLTKRVGNAERQARGIGADIQPRIEGAVRGIEAGVNARLGTLDRELGRIEHRDIPAIRAREKAIEQGATHVWEWIRRHPLSIASTAFAGTVAWALAKLGASWIRCNPFQQNAKALCRSHPGWWEDLLAGAIAIVGTVSFVEYVRDAQALEADALGSLRKLIRDLP